jgi:LiaF transmembrane domain
MRPRKSIFGPVLLIVLGSILLARNLDPTLSLANLFADYWPWILIFWGSFRLVEFALARLRGRRPPEPLGAAAVLIAIFLCLAGSTAHTFSRNEFEFLDWLRLRNGWFDLEFDYPVHHQQTVGPGQAVLIRNLEGRVRIVASEGSGLRIDGHKRVRAFNDRSAATLDERSLLEISPQAQQMIVQPRPLPERDSRRVSYDVDIALPAATALRVEGARGQLDVQGLSGDVFLEGAASIAINDVGGPVHIEAHRAPHITARRLASTLAVGGRVRRIEAEQLAGALTIEGSAVEEVLLSKLNQPARLHFQNTDLTLQKLPGNLEITPGKVEIVDAAGPLVLNRRGSRTAGIRLERISGALTVEAEHSDLELLARETPPPATNVRIGHGDINVVLAPNAAFTIEASTAHGSASHDFGEAIHLETKDQAATLRGGRGQGPRLKLETSRGDITVESAKKPFGSEVEI